MTYKYVLSWYFRLRISIQDKEFSSFRSETFMEGLSLTPFWSRVFQAHVSPQLISLSFLSNAVILTYQEKALMSIHTEDLPKADRERDCLKRKYFMSQTYASLQRYNQHKMSQVEIMSFAIHFVEIHLYTACQKIGDRCSMFSTLIFK